MPDLKIINNSISPARNVAQGRTDGKRAGRREDMGKGEPQAVVMDVKRIRERDERE